MDNAAQSQIITRLRSHIPARAWMVAVLIAMGVATGAGAYILKKLVIYINHGVMALIPSAHSYAIIIVPAIGMLIAVAYMRYGIRQNISHGAELVRQRLLRGEFYLRPSMMISPILASSVTLGFGGSAGGEGPIATAGAAIGSNFGRYAGLTRDQLIVITACGAGAGIAAIFKAPVGGMFYTLEVLALPLTTVNVISLAIACISSGLTAYVLSGNTLDLAFTTPPADVLQPVQYIFVILLGLFMGLYSLYYSRIISVMKRWYESISSRWTRALIAGSITGLLILIFPALYGEGYEVMRAIIHGDPDKVLTGPFHVVATATPLILLLVTAGVMMVKAIGTSSATNGGVAGDFSPALFAGCMAGYVFTAALNFIPGMELPLGAMVLTGMAAAMSGIIKAPLMSIFIVVEMTGNPQLFLPIALASGLSYAVVAISSR